MCLEDTCELLSPKRPEKMERILECFRSGREPVIQDLMSAADLSEDMTRYFLTKMRKLKLIESYEGEDGETHYVLKPSSFETFVELAWVDPLKRLIR